MKPIFNDKGTHILKSSVVLTDSSDGREDKNIFKSQSLSKNKSGVIEPIKNLSKKSRMPKFKINAVEYDDIAKIDSSSN